MHPERKSSCSAISIYITSQRVLYKRVSREGHLGSSKMKGTARGMMECPDLDIDNIEDRLSPVRSAKQT